MKMEKNIIEQIHKIVEDGCKKKTNYFGYGSWSHHIISVVKYTKLLAKKLNADEEVVEIAALLHDYASVSNKDWYPEHHKHGARLAEEILKKFNYPQDKIEKIKHCILSHRASQNIKGETVEAEILSDADHMSHFDNVNSLLYLAFLKHNLDIDEGTKWVLNKLGRSWEKLSPEAKEIIKLKCEAATLILS